MILFCDFDGTLFRRDIEGDLERNLEAIQRWREAGNLFVMTTGRSPSSLEAVLPNYFDYFDYMIGDNGAVCLTKDGIEFEETISEVAQRDITEFAKSLPHGDEFEFVYDRDCHGFSDIQGAATKLRIWTVNPEIMEATIAKLKERYESDFLMLGMHRAQPSLSFLRAGHTAAVNIMAPTAGKDRALARIAAKHSEMRAFAVGDGSNDVAMLQTYDGYIMRTARDELRDGFNSWRLLNSVAELIDRLMVFDDIKNKIGVDICDEELKFYYDGSTDSIVFSVQEKYLIKITSEQTVRHQQLFLSNNTHEAFQKLLCSDEKLHYECFEFIDGTHYDAQKIDKHAAVEQLASIVGSYVEFPHDKYGFLDDEKDTWADFLLDEIDYAKKRIPTIPQDRVMNALEVVREYSEPKQYLMHGDFGTHNFLLESDSTIRVIDPMPMVGDRIYDFYFAVLSNVGIFRDLGEDYLMQFFSNVDLRYRRALMTIALYVRMSRAAYYDNEHLPDYEKLYEEGFER